MSVLSDAAIAGYARSAGFTGQGLVTAVAVALAESGGNPQAYNPETAAGTAPGRGSYGLWQIYVTAHPEYGGNPQALYNPATNAQAAFRISSGGTNWRPWSTYTSGAYSQYIPRATQAAGAPAVSGGPGTPPTVPQTSGAGQTSLAAFVTPLLTGDSTTVVSYGAGTDVFSAYRILLAIGIMGAAIWLLSKTRAGYAALYYTEVLILLFLFATQSQFFRHALTPLNSFTLPPEGTLASPDVTLAALPAAPASSGAVRTTFAV